MVNAIFSSFKVLSVGMCGLTFHKQTEIRRGKDKVALEE